MEDSIDSVKELHERLNKYQGLEGFARGVIKQEKKRKSEMMLKRVQSFFKRNSKTMLNDKKEKYQPEVLIEKFQWFHDKFPKQEIIRRNSFIDINFHVNKQENKRKSKRSKSFNKVYTHSLIKFLDNIRSEVIIFNFSFYISN